MTPTVDRTIANHSPALDPDTIRHLAGYGGPCLTLQVPDHHPGAREGSHRSILRDLINQAHEQLMASTFGPRAADLLRPIEALAYSTEVEAGGPGFVVFRGPDVFARYTLPSRDIQRLIIGNYFHLTPFVAGAFAAQPLLILGLSKNRLRFFELAHGECRELPLPAGVPRSLDAAEDRDTPEHRLESRATAGPSTGSMHAVQFGVPTDRESGGRRLAQFFRSIDGGLKPALGGRPLFIMGVREEVNAYRRAAAYPHILSGEADGNVEHMSLAEIASLATSAALAHYYDLGTKVLAEYVEMPDRTRTLHDASEILPAASQGRVHRLCFRPGESALVEKAINAAVVETLRNGGEVFSLPADRMRTASPMAAILRY